jgi:hypothetical protein
MEDIVSTLLPKVKANLILQHDEDDALLRGMIEAAVAFAEGFQHRPAGYYATNPMPATTERGIIMLASHNYESRDGSTGGFYADNVNAAKQAREAANNLLRMDRDWMV